jgi:hypothetical protein
MASLYIKAVAVAQSCRTADQLEVAARFAQHARRMELRGAEFDKGVGVLNKYKHLVAVIGKHIRYPSMIGDRLE